MKTHTSMKSICNNWHKVYQCGYCDLQYIMRGIEPMYYNSGVYGWNCDIYVDGMHDIAISTGYRNMRGRMIPSELIKKYSDKAKAIIDEFATPWEDMKEALADNAERFFDELATI